MVAAFALALGSAGSAEAASANGHIAFAPSAGGQVYSVSPKGGRPTQVSHDPAGAAHPGWSRDGRLLAYDVGGERLVVVPAGGGAERVLDLAISAIDPTWSPDGRALAFSGVVYDQNRGVEDSSIYVSAADGSNYFRIGPGSEPAWSPRGDWIAYRSNPARTGGCAGIWRMRSDGSGNAPVVPGEPRGSGCAGGGMDPSFAPNGKHVVFVSLDGHSIYTCGLNGRGRHLVVRGSTFKASPVYSPDGKQIAYSAAGSGIYRVSARGGRPHRVAAGTGYIAWQPLPG